MTPQDCKELYLESHSYWGYPETDQTIELSNRFEKWMEVLIEKAKENGQTTYSNKTLDRYIMQMFHYFEGADDFEENEHSVYDWTRELNGPEWAREFIDCELISRRQYHEYMAAYWQGCIDSDQWQENKDSEFLNDKKVL